MVRHSQIVVFPARRSTSLDVAHPHMQLVSRSIQGHLLTPRSQGSMCCQTIPGPRLISPRAPSPGGRATAGSLGPRRVILPCITPSLEADFSPARCRPAYALFRLWCFRSMHV